MLIMIVLCAKQSIWNYRIKGGMIGLLLCVLIPSLRGQGYTAWSVQGHLSALLNREETYLSKAYLITPKPAVEEYGFSVLRRKHFRLSPFSMEYGMGLLRSYSRLNVSSLTDSREVVLDRYGIAAPFRVFYGGEYTEDARKRQSGLFIESISAIVFSEDLRTLVFDTHLGLGARTRGRYLYGQLSFGWPIVSTISRFLLADEELTFKQRARRAGLLIIGFQFP